MRWTLLFLAASRSVALAYIWPNPQIDMLEDAYTVTAGFGSTDILAEVTPCSNPPGGTDVITIAPGRQTAAEWLRTAYHDMATHDSSTGLGGLDGSIGFETLRPENIGTAFNTTLLFFRPTASKRVSLSDLLSLGVVLAIKNCGGPSVPFRPGRVDATEAGPPGVPQPQESLDTHVAEFARQGFNATEMIALVACGHTLGGVHQVDFPSIVSGAITADNPEGVVHFDDTFDVYDNHIATQYINGSSVDPLILNSTSDAAIFGSDGNQTMLRFAQDPDFFSTRCSELLGRMLDTVPASVELGDAIEPLTVKPFEMSLFFNVTGGLQLSGNIRIFGTSAEAAAANPLDMPVTLVWKDRHGGSSSQFTTPAVSADFLAATSLFGSVQFFSFDVDLDSSLGISSFVVQWAYDTNSALTTADNGGAGFPFQDVILFQHAGSCHGAVNQNSTINVVIRNDMGAVSSAYMEYTFSSDQPGTLVFKQNTFQSVFTHTGNSTSPFYDTWSTSFVVNDGFSSVNQSIVSIDFVAVVAGTTYSSLDNPQLFTGC
ncbi:heme peroxidase [Roridomyces roridus]|uniref:Peroxidase n=1 Tax=Roridomyces roridus TaxID=1738132 RepID=A0AAD7G313_9AGAR|nr:heme peroxidase [Roridomyces roridus]